MKDRERPVKLRTWHVEAGAQAALYLGAILAQFGTLARPELVLAASLWFLGRAASRADRQRERWEAAGVTDLMRRHSVECAAGSLLDLRLASIGFGVWGLTIGSWLTLGDVLWTACYPVWRRRWRRVHPTDATQAARPGSGRG